MKIRVTTVLVPWLALTALACADSSDGVPTVEGSARDLRAVSSDEALADFDQMVTEFRTLYGALERKQALYDFSFDDFAAATRTQLTAATSEAEVLGIFNRFVARFEDAHLAIADGAPPDDSNAFSLPLLVMPIEDTYVVYWVDPSLENAPLARGDELLSIDGTSAAELAQRFAGYDGAPNANTLDHLTATYLTQRLPYLAGDLKDGQSVTLTLRSAGAALRDVTLNWHATPHVLPPTAAPVAEHHCTAFSRSAQRVASDELLELGSKVPFFMTQHVVDTYGIQTGIVPSALAVQQFDVIPGLVENPPYTAYVYTYRDTRILLLRLGDYGPAYSGLTDEQAITLNLNWLRALLYDQANAVDGLVIDQTHNPGGNLEFANAVLGLLAKQAVPGVVQKMHGDRVWIQAYLDAAQEVRQGSTEDNPEAAVELEALAHQVDLAYSNGVALTDPIAFPGIPDTVEPDAQQGWSKPVLILTDELSASCADIVPLVVQADGLGTLFGARTMGAGGTVEPVASLPNTNYALHLSRGLLTVRDPSGAYPEARFIEDHGVTPDVEYAHSLADFRAGYVGYVGAFSDAMVDVVQAK